MISPVVCGAIRQPPRLCEPPCAETQAGVGPISQKPELLTMGRTYNGERDGSRTELLRGRPSAHMVKAVLSICERKFLRKGGIYAAVNFKHLGKTDGERRVVDGKGPISRRLFCYLGLSEIVILSGVLMALAPASNARKGGDGLVHRMIARHVVALGVQVERGLRAG